MSTVAPPANVADMLQNLSLDSKAKTESTNKTAMDSKARTLLPSDALDPSVFYVPNGYHPYYCFGSEYPAYTSSESTGYRYAAYPYSPATSPAPQVGGDGQLYGAQQCVYPPYFPLTTSSGPFASSVPVSTNKATNVKTLSSASDGASKGSIPKGVNGSAPVKPLNKSARNSALGGGPYSGYQDPWFYYSGYYPPASWLYGSNFPDVQRSVSGSGVASSYSKANNNVPASRNQNYRSNSHYKSMYQPASMTGYAAQDYYNRVYPSKSYGQYGSTVRSGMGYGYTGYDSRRDERGWVAVDNRSKRWGRGNESFYRSEHIDGLNELNRGPRAAEVQNQKDEEGKEQKGDESNITMGNEETITCTVPDREEYNREDFPVEHKDGMFFIIKSYSEDDVHKGIKYNVWASTPNGNKKLDAAYQKAQEKPGGCPVFLLFSVNSSGQFVGLAEMIGPVDFNKNVECWQQDKWTGSFPLKWHIVKDVPNSSLKHITLEYNENKPVTHSRDTQEVELEEGLKIVKIFKEHNSKTCIFDDFSFYEGRQKTILETKAMQQLSRKQVWECKNNEEHKETVTADIAKESDSTVQPMDDLKVGETTDSSNTDKPVGVIPNGC